MNRLRSAALATEPLKGARRRLLAIHFDRVRQSPLLLAPVADWRSETADEFGPLSRQTVFLIRSQILYPVLRDPNSLYTGAMLSPSFSRIKHRIRTSIYTAFKPGPATSKYRYFLRCRERHPQQVTSALRGRSCKIQAQPPD